MDVNVLTTLITTLGFPIVCVLGLGFFIYRIYLDTQEQNKENMNAVQARCKEREDKLYEEIKANREVNASAIATIAHYAEKLDIIQSDIHDIKTDITILTTKSQ